MSSRLFNTGTPQETLGFSRLPLLVATPRRRWGRPAWFAIGVILGLLVEALAR